NAGMQGLAGPPRAVDVERWLRTQPGYEAARIDDLRPVDGGASNITCRLELRDAPVANAALRIQRGRGIFEPYDVLREGEVLRRLAASPVPVPRVLLDERDPVALGAPFLLLEWIDAPHMGEAGPHADFGAYVQMVAAIHALDWRALGLDVLGVPATPREAVAGELDLVAARMPTFGCDDDPALVAALGTLRAAVPDDGELRFCQGDINVFNYLFREGKVVGVVDWEQARIGDARSDIGQLVTLAHLKGAPFGPAEAQPFAQAYAAVSGRPLANLGYFRALWAFELAVIYHGWVAFNGSEPWFTRDEVYGLLQASLADL
ncbi:MAG: phosphotransferase family protein, partial [Hyphomicrobiales bacterium]